MEPTRLALAATLATFGGLVFTGEAMGASAPMIAPLETWASHEKDAGVEFGTGAKRKGKRIAQGLASR
jgi:hypothetical protein